ncbi:DUF1398 family protein [Conexibacter sp. CPCC 206217]|uniref:DUF1398 family protein n=1 Tax=Conexibacter sp. CPCC 206217 TaxID=3064574 RepID=UPI002727103B|nr:DUF1398 family protein [Conexibacter sp. CPCC 206217]MDO8212154.1 DUF1398 family protein [Conexibacter sp. CPCC 206217]
MSTAITTVEAALQRGAAIRPAVGGFPHLAASLREAGVSRCHVVVPSNAFVYFTTDGPVVMQHEPIASGIADVAPFDEPALVAAIRTDQAGESAFPDFIAAIWAAGVLTYDVDLTASTCTYHGADGASYVERFELVAI